MLGLIFTKYIYILYLLRYNIAMEETESLKGELVVDGRFEWWSKKDEANVIKHRYSFKEIEGVFSDPFFYEMYDEKHSTAEQARYFGLGSIADKFLVLQVSYTEDERIHIISARDATPKEMEVYFERLRRIHR